MNIMTFVYIAFAVFTAIGFITGLIKGLFRSTLDAGCVAINGIASGITATIVAKNVIKPEKISQVLTEVLNNISDPATQDTIKQMQVYLDNPDSNTKAVSLVMALVAVVILPLLFLICYIAYALILVVPKLIIQFIFVPKARTKAFKWSGAAVGAVANIIAFAIFLMPIIGYVTFANDTLEQLKTVEQGTTEELSQLQATADNLLAVTKPINDDFLTKTINALGGNAMFNSLTTIRVDKTKISLKAETECALNIYSEVGHFSAPPAEYGQEQIESIERIEIILQDAEFVPSLIANCLSYVANEWDQGRDVFGMQKPNLGADFQESVDQVVHILAQTNEDNFKKDVLTITSIGKDCIEDGVLEKAMGGNPGEIVSVLENTDILSDILVALHSNERFRPAIPHIASGVTNYVYKVYDEVNGTTTPKHEIINYDDLTKDDAKAEGEKISRAIKEINIFIASVQDADFENDMIGAIKAGDFAALGRGCNEIRATYLFKDTFEFLLSAILKSETCSQLGIIDDDFVEQATKPDADLEKMLVTRQHLAILVIALKDGDKAQYNDAIKTIIAEISAGEGESLQTILTYSNLRSMGLNKEKAKTISSLLTSLVTSADGKTYTEEERIVEAEATGAIVNAVNSAIDNKDKGSNVFNTSSDAQDGVSNITADEFVETTIKSDLVSSMIEEVITNDEGEIVDDPYNIHNKLSESDLSAIENALVNEYNKEGVKDDPETVAKLENLAHIVGIDTSELFK